MLKNMPLIVLWISVLTGCTQAAFKDQNIYSAYKPVLMDIDRVTSDVSMSVPREKANITKVLHMDNYLLALEYGRGLHIYDITDKDNPVNKGFYQVPACIDFEVQEHKVYANNYNDLLIMDFSSPVNPMITKRQANVFNISIKTPDGLLVHQGLDKVPQGTVIISYEKL